MSFELLSPVFRSDLTLSLVFQRFPTNVERPFGYLLALLFEFLAVLCFLILNACMTTYAFGSFLFGLSSCKEVKHSLHSLNKKSNHNGNESQIFTNLCDFIQLQTSVRQLSILFFIFSRRNTNC